MVDSEGSSRQAFLVGGGIASIAAAYSLIEDAGLSGADIHMIERDPVL